MRLTRRDVRQGRTDFVRFFGGALAAFESCAWLVRGAIFALPPEWELGYDVERDRPLGPEWDKFLGYAVAVEDARNPSTLSLQAPGFLQQYARYLVDDWCDIAAVPHDAATPQLVQRATKYAHLYELPEVVACFSNIDAGAWEFRATDERVVADLQMKLRERPDVDLRALAESAPW
jgi:hypothetical protein